MAVIKQPDPVQLSIIIPVHNQWHLTQTCITSLLQFPPTTPFEIVVVDDGSTDKTPARLAGLSAIDYRIRFVLNSTPHRFARACNCGANVANGELLLIMNNDIEARESGWFEPLASVLQQRADVGIVAPRLLFLNGTVQHCGKVWSLGPDALPRSEHYLYEQSSDLPTAQQSGAFLTVTGACILLRRQQFMDIGPFDERYENGWEDDDLCLAFRSQGLLSWVCAESTLIHHQGGTLKAEALVLERYLGILKQKGITLASDDHFLVGLQQRTAGQAERFEQTWQRNRQLFLEKWGGQTNSLISCSSDGVTAQPHPHPNLLLEGEGTKNVTIVIVTYNSSGTITACLDSLARTVRQGDLVVIVDNHSQDDTCVLVQEFESRLALKLVRNSDNRGFSAASNQGIRLAVTPFVALLNPDTVVTPGWLERLAHYFENRSVVAVGPISNFAAGRQSVVCHWHGELPQGVGPEQASELLYQMNQGKSEETKLLIGFCLMIRLELLHLLGGLDERLFLGNDDLELSWRLRLHGHRLLIATDVFVWHEGQHSFKSDPATTTGRLVQESSDALYRILATHYGAERVPSPTELWGIDWFHPGEGAFNPAVKFDQVLSLPTSWVCPVSDAGLPLISIVILTYNQWFYTEGCLASIRQHTPEPYQLIVVDNGSSDGTRERLQALVATDSRYRLLLNDENRGYAAGCNQGMQQARGEYIVLLNNDVVVTPVWLSGLMECHGSHPQAGIVGPLTNRASGIQVVPQPDYAATGGLAGFARQFRIQNHHRWVRSRRVVGFCMLFKRSLIEEIGLLDEQFGTGNYEDDDLCLRAAVAGHQNLVAADVYIHHHGSMSFKGNKIDYRAALTRNAALFQEKWSRPVTDPLIGRRISICRVLEECEQTFLDDQLDKAALMIRQAVAEYPENPLLQELQERIESVVRSACPVLQQVELLRKQGDCEYANAIILNRFMHEPWHPQLQNDMLDLGRDGYPGLSIRADEAFRLYPSSRGLARLRTELAGLEERPETGDWAESFLAGFGPDDRVLQAGREHRKRCGMYQTTGMPGKSVALCMIVKDEEQQLARCLASCRPLVHEMILVDTGSSDRTRQIAGLFGAQVISLPWQNDFSSARNCSIERATTDWILVMDADEAISPRDYQVFKDILVSATLEQAYIMTTRNYTTSTGLEGLVPCRGDYPESEAGVGWTPSDKVRLFPNRKGISFQGVIHEMVDETLQQAGVTMAQHPVPVHHYGGLQQQKNRAKQEQYLALGLKKLAEQPDDVKALYELAVQAAELEQYATAEQLWMQLLAYQPDFARGWFNLGYVLLRQGKLQESLRASERAQAMDPDLTDALINLTICETCLCTGEQAYQRVMQAQQRCPEQPALLGLAVLALYRIGKATEGRQLVLQLQEAGMDCRKLFCGVRDLMQQQGATTELAAVVQAVTDASSSTGAAESISSCS
jgi:O-antigen biosynthesis protein